MPEGPFGFVRIGQDKRVLLVAVGLDQGRLPREILQDVEFTVEDNLLASFKEVQKVTISHNENPAREAREKLGPRTQVIVQFDVFLDTDEIRHQLPNEIIDKVDTQMRQLGFNVTGIEAKVA